MPVSYHVFRLLSFKEQLALLWMEGTFLLQLPEVGGSVALYHLAGDFFCELYYDEADHAILLLRPFTEITWLENYICSIGLNDLLDSA